MAEIPHKVDVLSSGEFITDTTRKMRCLLVRLEEATQDGDMDYEDLFEYTEICRQLTALVQGLEDARD